MRSLLAMLMLALSAVSCSATQSCPAGAQQQEWDAACFAGTGAQRQLKPEHVRKLSFDTSGHAVISIAAPRELVALDRRGRVVVPGIFHTGDFDYPQPRGQLARFRDGGKCGYFNVRDFSIAVPASYDQCQSFGATSGQVCNDCALYCTVRECQDSMLIGGQGWEIDQHHRVLRRFAPPTLTQACNGAPPARVEQRQDARPWLQCAPAPGTPFGQLR